MARRHQTPPSRSRTNPGSTTTSIAFSRRYLAALRQHLAERPRAGSQPAKRLAHQALAAGLETLDLAKIHEQALLTLVSPDDAPRTQARMIKRASAFFVEALTPIESTHRLALESNGHLRHKNLSMRQRAVDLAAGGLIAPGPPAATHRRLTREIARRKAVEHAFKKSQQLYAQLLEKSRYMQEQLRRLSHEILSTQEEERKRISRELHDEIGQILTAINVRLVTLKQQAAANTKGLEHKVASTQRLVEQSMNTVHRFARELRPPLLDDLGLIPALHSHMKRFTKRSRIHIRFTAVAAVEQLAADGRTALYRVAQEALTNVAKHARASLVTVSIRKLQDAVRMEIHDNGKSFQVKHAPFSRRTKRLGLVGMRERMEMLGGSFTVQSSPGKGTTVCAQIPFSSGRPA